MPQVTASWFFPLINTSHQVVLAVIICLLDIVESTTIARRTAQLHGYKLDFNQELRALGLANIMGSIFNCYTTTGAFSRTTVNSLAGAKTLLSSFVTGIFIMIILLWCTPIFTHLSVNVQGSIICVAILPLFDFQGGYYYWEVSKLDFLCWLVAYFVTATAGALPGILSAFGLSSAIVILKAGFPRMTSYAKEASTGAYVDPTLYNAEKSDIEGILVVRVEAPLFYGNLAAIQNHIDEEVKLRAAAGDVIKVVILDMDMSPDIDGAFCYTFKFYLEELRRDGISLVLANPSKKVILKLQRSALIVQVRPENLQQNMDDALARAHEIIAQGDSALPTAAEKEA